MARNLLSRDFYGGTLPSLAVTGLTLSESCYPPALKMPRHQHEPAYFSLVLQGSYSEKLGIKGSTREGRPHAALFHPQGESHAVIFHAAPVHILRVELGPQWLDRMSLFDRIPDAPLSQGNDHVMSLARRLYREFQHRDRWSTFAIEGLTLELMAELGRAATASPKNRKPSSWIQTVREQLEAVHAEFPTLEELATQAGVHPVHLSREFRKQFGVTPSEFLRRRRIEQASEQLAHSDRSLCEIALEAGFYDQSHFTNAFKRQMGMTPTAYRALFYFHQ
ncbi:MAG: helix-turn-helix transcriptional regulator [Blastocatellia bacterium]|nr:helix-turn-helix transcriptional regulator [Blastocatellia bacterium]